MSKQVLVYADWQELGEPDLVGYLQADLLRNKEHFSFSYAESWLQNSQAQAIDPSLHLYAGVQHAANSKNFHAFLDSCPDRWGRVLMTRREAALAAADKRKPKALYEIDYLLGVHDLYRQGALRFKLEAGGKFLDDDNRLAAPPMSSLAELEHAVKQVENNKTDDPEYLNWLYMLMSPGSSLGGARPKASVLDKNQHLWLAKFPSLNDVYDVGLWEFLVYQLAVNAGVRMAESQVKKLNSQHHTFLTKRFDRANGSRLHFSSALTQLGYYDGDYEASYLELAQFLTENGAKAKQDLAQLWRRIVFSIAVSNSDDHLRNHGFIWRQQGWILSPAYDINPSLGAQGLHLNITDTDNRLDFDLALSVIEFFQLSKQEALQIKEEVLQSVRQWQALATQLGVSRQEQQQLCSAFWV
jgi:serine/threonine-protein kinase HipA